MRKILLSLMFGLFIVVLAACGANSSNDELSVPREDQFIVGLECAYAPYNWTTSNETITSVKTSNAEGYCDGYDVKVARLIAIHLDKELVIKALDWNALIPQLTGGSIDAIVAGMSPTEERKSSIDFSDVYYRSEQVVVVKGDSDYANATSINDFSGAKITAQKNTLQEDLVTQLTGAVQSPSLDDYAKLVTATSTNSVDGFIAELPVAMKAVSNNPSLKFIQFSDGNGFDVDDAHITTSIGLRKDETELKNEINSVLATIPIETRNEWMNVFVNME